MKAELGYIDKSVYRRDHYRVKKTQKRATSSEAEAKKGSERGNLQKKNPRSYLQN